MMKRKIKRQIYDETKTKTRKDSMKNREGQTGRQTYMQPDIDTAKEAGRVRSRKRHTENERDRERGMQKTKERER